MTVDRPLASVVIPTRDRRDSLSRTLASLGHQDCGPSAFEVVVAVNASTDDTESWLSTARHPFTVRVARVDRAGASRARNAGARAATAPLLLFLDDDIEAWTSLVSAHLAAHGGTHAMLASSARVAIGYLPARLQPERDRFAITLRAWWEAMFDRMREPGHRFAWTDLLSGNCSLSRERFLSCGMFEESLVCHEDYELGYRLIEAGAELVFAERAAGWHRDETRVDRACARKRAEGAADAWVARRHPSLRTSMPMARAATPRQRLSRWLAFTWPAAGDAGARLMLGVLPLLDRVGASMAWLRVLYAVFGYWYERGLADALGDRAALKALLEGAWQQPRALEEGVRLDIASGLDQAEVTLDRERPLAATIVVADRLVCRMPWVPGSEPLASRHLAPYLRRYYHEKIVRAQLATGALTTGDLLRGADRVRREDHAGAPAG